jgi:quercetin dioxygenase-like cupin family protein
MGYHAMAFDFPAEENELHWHDFDSVVYVTGGEVTVSAEGEGESVTCQRGAKIVATAGVVHREQTQGYSAIVGFSVPLESLTQPINKPLPVVQ